MGMWSFALLDIASWGNLPSDPGYGMCTAQAVMAKAKEIRYLPYLCMITISYTGTGNFGN